MDNLKAKSIILLFLIVFLVVGCSSSGHMDNYNPSQESTESTAVSEPVTILKYAQWSVPLTDVVEEAIKDYSDTNQDNIRVELVKIPRSRYNDTINMLLSSGDGPDVFEARSEWLFSYIYKNWLYELTDRVEESFLADFPEWAKKLAYDDKFANHFYSIPSNQVTYRLIYNKDLFKRAGLNPERPPKNLDELVSFAKKITDSGIGDRIYGFALPANDIWNGFIQPMEAINFYSGKYFFDYKEGTYDLNVYQPWFEAFMSLKESKTIFPGEMTMKEDLALLQFAEGNIGMMFAPSWEPVLLHKLFSTKCNWAVALPPSVNLENAGKGYIGIDASGWQVVNNRSVNLNKAILFWKYIYSKEYNTKLYHEGCLLPVMNDIITDPGKKPEVLNFDKFMPGQWDAVYPPTPLDIDEFSRANVYISIFNGLLPLESGLTNESYRLNMLLDKYGITGRVNIKNYTDPDIHSSAVTN